MKGLLVSSLPLNQLVSILARSYTGELQKDPTSNQKILYAIHYKSTFRREAAPTPVPPRWDLYLGLCGSSTTQTGPISQSLLMLRGMLGLKPHPSPHFPSLLWLRP